MLRAIRPALGERVYGRGRGIHSCMHFTQEEQVPGWQVGKAVHTYTPKHAWSVAVTALRHAHTGQRALTIGSRPFQGLIPVCWLYRCCHNWAAPHC